MKAVILAGGKGNRLLPLTLTKPKTIIEINGKPIIDYILESLPDQIDEVVIIVEHLKEQIISHIGDSFHNKKVTYIDQIEMRGTFGALLSTKDIFKPDEKFLVLNGDDINKKEELEKYILESRAFGIQKMHMPNYHSIRYDKDCLIEGFYPQTEDEKVSGTFVATGVYMIDSNIFTEEGFKLKDGEYGLPQTLLLQKDKYPLKAVETEGWLPINSFEDKEKAEEILKNK